MRIYPSPVCRVSEQKPWPTVGTGVPEAGTFPHLRSSLAAMLFLLPPQCGLADAIPRQHSSRNDDAAELLRSDGLRGETGTDVLHVTVREIAKSESRSPTTGLQ
jgi:hypothetical protein